MSGLRPVPGHWVDGLVSALFAALILLPFAFAPPGPMEMGDALELHWPYREYLRASIWDGEFPWWNPYCGLGRPFAADPEAAVFYPPTWLVVLLPVVPAVVILTWAHLVFGALGGAALARWAGAGRWMALAAGLVLVASGPFVGRLSGGSFPYVHVLCWLPWLLRAAAAAVEAPGRRNVGWLALATAGPLLAGHPQPAWIGLVGAGVLAGVLAAALGLRRGVLGLAHAGTGVALGLALCCLPVALGAELMQESNRVEPGAEFSRFDSARAINWLRVFVPGTADAGQMHWTVETSAYAGALVAAGGVLALLSRWDRRVAALAAVALAGVAVGSAGQWSAVDQLFQALPGYAGLRMHSRMGVLVTAALLPLAARALSAPADWRAASRLGVVWLIVGAAILLASRGDFERPGAWDGLVFGIAGVLVWAWAGGAGPSLRRSVLAPLAVALIALDLALSAADLKTQLWRVPRPPPTEGRVLAAVERLQAEARNAGDHAPVRVAVAGFDARPNLGMLHGYANVGFFGSLWLNRPWTALHVAGRLRPNRFANTALPNELWKGSRGLVGFAARSLRPSAVVPVGEVARAWTTSTARPAPPLAELTRDLDGPWTDTLQIPASPEPSPLVPARRQAATVTSFSRNRVVVEAHPAEAGWLFLAEAWYPGWTVTVNGQPGKVLQGNTWMRVAEVPAGPVLVEFEYRPALVPVGVALTLVVALLIIGLLRPRPVQSP